MILLLTLLSALSVVSNGASRYVIQNFTTLGAGNAVPYPLDLCLNYEVALVNFAKVALFGIYSCNSNNDAVSFQSYGQDAACQAASASGDPTVVSAAVSTPGTIGEFNCVGEDNYAITDGCTTSLADTEPTEGDDGTEAVCCQPYSSELYACSPTIFAMGVCIYAEQDGTPVYQSTSCDADGTVQHLYAGADTTCAGSVIADLGSTDVDYCAFRERAVVVDVYVRMNSCVEGGSVVSNDTYCPPPTSAPSMSPSMPSVSPSMSPSKSPTSTTGGEESSDNGVGPMYVTGYIMVMTASVAIYMVQ